VALSTLTLSRTPESDIIRALGSGNGSRCRPVGGTAMPVYEYHCDKCQRAVTLALSIREHEKGKFTCPTCGSKALRPLVSTFFSQTKLLLVMLKGLRRPPQGSR